MILSCGLYDICFHCYLTLLSLCCLNSLCFKTYYPLLCYLLFMNLQIYCMLLHLVIFLQDVSKNSSNVNYLVKTYLHIMFKFYTNNPEEKLFSQFVKKLLKHDWEMPTQIPRVATCILAKPKKRIHVSHFRCNLHLQILEMRRR